MEDKVINQFGDKCIYMESGNVYLESYVEETSSAFEDCSFGLHDYCPTIKPPIKRIEVDQILDWIGKKSSAEKSSRLSLLYGKAGIGKSIVMHDLLNELELKKDYLVLGLKTDQSDFQNANELSTKMHLSKPIDILIKEIAPKYNRVVLLIDQIDALSHSLSSNRTPLRSMLNLIKKVSLIEHVRVVVSCRPYDLEYDPLLESLNVSKRWELKELSSEKVMEILKDNGCKEQISNNLNTFLGNPLHLYLFLKVRLFSQLTDPLTTDLLYNELWRKYIVNAEENDRVSKDYIVSLLDSMVTTMYERQELYVHIRDYETRYSIELKYLFSCGFLILAHKTQVQFFHQTLFDYVYARIFIEKRKNLLDELKSHHQGLFSRASVKSILTFLREQNPSEYIHTLTKLLFDEDNDRKYIYRYHLKSLALSNMVYFEAPIQDEISLIQRKIFDNELYMGVILESVHNSSWFSAIWSVIDYKVGWAKLSASYKEKVMIMCRRTLWSNSELVLDTVEKKLDYSNEDDRKYIGELLQNYNLNCSSEKLIAIYNKLVKTRNPLEYTYLLRKIINDNPVFVCNELKENIKLQLLNKESQSIRTIQISQDVEPLYEDLKMINNEQSIKFYVEILNIIYESTKFKIPESEIYNSFELSYFQRAKGGHMFSNFTNYVTNILIDNLLADFNEEYVKRYIFKFSESNYECFVYIALFLYTSKPNIFKENFFNVIIKRSFFSNAPSLVQYQTIEALKSVFDLMSDTQKEICINKILTIHENSEWKLYSMDMDMVKMRLQYGHPILDIDLYKGNMLEIIPKDELKKYSWKAYQERLRLDRKFTKERLINEMPFRTNSQAGWTSLTPEQAEKMSCKTWYISMQKYNNNNHSFDWDRPSLTGQCHLFRSVVSSDPDKFIKLLDDVVKSPNIPLDYAISGMQGLIDASRIEAAEYLLKEILIVIDDNVNSSLRGFNLHSMLFALSDIVKGGNIPRSFFEFICYALKNADETLVDDDYKEKDIYNKGLNQTRGNAGYMLVECAECDQSEEYKEEIFRTLESIADTASVYTRSAILFNMASLNLLDKNRNVTLFNKLMHDFDPRLMAMPVHNYNPLVYFVNYAIDEIIEFLTHASNCPECYSEEVIILWLAWSHNNSDERVKVLLDKMCETSEEARISLLNFLCTLRERVNENAISYILYFMEPKFDSSDMGEACDNIFHNIKSWPEDMQYKIASTFVSSPLSAYKITSFVKYLAGYAIKDPVQALRWLEMILVTNYPKDYSILNQILDVIIQAYNGIKSFNDSCYQDTLEHAMDLIDEIMQSPSDKFFIVNFINKLDNE